MTIESQIAALTVSTTALTNASIFRQATLIAAVTSASNSATAAAISAAAAAAAAGVRVNLADFGSSMVVGTAATTVDIAGILTFSQVTAGISVTLPNPTVPGVHKTMVLENLPISAQSITVIGGDTSVLSPGASRMVQWNGTAWKQISGGGSSQTAQNVTTTGSATAWNSILVINSPTATTQTLPDSPLTVVGQSILVKNVGAGFATVAAFAGNTVTGVIPTLAAGNSVTLTVSAVGVLQVTASFVASVTSVVLPATLGQTAFTLPSAPTDAPGVRLEVNGKTERAPSFSIAGVTLTWGNSYLFSPADYILAIYN